MRYRSRESVNYVIFLMCQYRVALEGGIVGVSFLISHPGACFHTLKLMEIEIDIGALSLEYVKRSLRAKIRRIFQRFHF